MIAETLVEVPCAVCGMLETETVCSAEEVRAQLRYLRGFHRRRLRDAEEGALAERAEFTQDYATDIVRCAGCGLLFRNPRPPSSAIERAYSQDQYGRQRLEELCTAQAGVHRCEARSLARWLRPGARVIEVGSFVGGFLAAGRERGWRMLGVDPGEEVTAFCAEHGQEVFRGSLDRITGSDLPRGWACGTVDCIAIWNAFDQLPDPEPTLQAARSLLRPGGILAVRVPNGECFQRGVARMRRPGWAGAWTRALLAWNNLLAFPYLYGHSVRSLDWLLSWHGLERVTAEPDTLCRLSDHRTRTWAALEERLLKTVARWHGRWEARRPGSSLSSPWFNAYYRLRG